LPIRASIASNDGGLGGGLASATITVTPVNDPPSLLDHAFSVVQGTSVSTLVGTVTGSDVDAGDSLSYSIVGGDPGGAFAIDPLTGSITVANVAALGIASDPAFSLTIQAQDSSGATASATATVDVTLSYPEDLLPDPEPEEVEPDPEPVEEPSETKPDSDSEEEPPEAGPTTAVPPIFVRTDLETGFFQRSAGEVIGTSADRVEGEAQSLEPLRFDLQNRDVDELDAVGRLMANQRMMDALDRVRQEIIDDSESRASEQRMSVTVMDSAALASSLGLLSILSRASSLAAAAMSSLPIWRGVDPLAVLAISEEERKQREKDLRDAQAAEDDADRAVGRLLDDA
jgi:hypothetical protein